MADAMQKYDELPGEKTWRDLATVAYNAYKHHKEFELVSRSYENRTYPQRV